jgi:hypothetical protein
MSIVCSRPTVGRFQKPEVYSHHEFIKVRGVEFPGNCFIHTSCVSHNFDPLPPLKFLSDNEMPQMFFL